MFQPCINLGPILQNEDTVVHVAMETDGGVEATGMAASAVIVSYANEGDAALSTYTPSVAQWQESAKGQYQLTVPIAVTAFAGLVQVLVDAVAAGYKTFRGFGRVEPRPVQVFCAPSYDSGAQRLTFVVWAHCNGQLITAPSSCRVTVTEEGAGVVVDALSSSPDANGLFIVEATTLTLTVKKNFKIRAYLTWNGVQYSSGDAMQTFN